MKISTLLRFLFCGFVASALYLNASAQSTLGQIRAVRVQGEVLKLATGAAAVPMKEGEDLKETDTVSTGKGASVVLVFENGSSVRVGGESRLAIEEFKIDPLDQPIANLSELKAEPSRSKTVLNLSYGEMVGDVKKLNTAGGSSYNIKTPVGAAGIRGTIYRIVFKPSADGKAFFTISTAEGQVVMQGVTPVDIPVDMGKEVVVEIDTENPTNPVVVNETNISPAVLAQITTAAQELTQAIKETQDTPPPPKQEEKPAEKQEEAKEETPPPPAQPVAPLPVLTSKAGE